MLYLSLRCSEDAGSSGSDQQSNGVIDGEIRVEHAAPWTRDTVNDQLILRSTLAMSGQESNLLARISYDSSTRRLTAKRFLLSDTPLYYVHLSGELVITTSVRCFIDHGFVPEEQEGSLGELLFYRCLAPPNTMFQGIKLLPAGGCLTATIEAQKISLSVSLYETLGEQIHYRSLPEACGALHALLEERISCLSSAAMKPSVILSGGIDSSIMCQIARAQHGLDHAYATAYPFEDPAKNYEREYALSAARMMNFSMYLHEFTTSEYLMNVVSCIAAAEQPIHHLQTACLYSLYKHIPRDSNLILQGLGAGGAFGNINTFLQRIHLTPFRRGLQVAPMPFLKWCGRFSSRFRLAHQDRTDSLHATDLNDWDNPIWRFRAYGDCDWICGFLGTVRETMFQRRKEILQDMWDLDIRDVWARYSLLTDEEITRDVWALIAQSVGKATLSPWYDDAVLQFAFSIPWMVKMQPPGNLLRRGVAELAGVPTSIVSRPKTGFGIKTPNWHLPGAPLHPLHRILQEVIGDKEVSSLMRGGNKTAMTWWSLVNYAVWKSMFVDGASTEDLVAIMGQS